VDPVEPERLPDRPQLVEEELDGPEIRVVRPVGGTAPELVVDHEPPPVLRKLLERLEIPVARPGTAVEADERNAAIGPDVAVPGMEPAKRDAPLHDSHGRSGSRIDG
jgi:hypothetical protein